MSKKVQLTTVTSLKPDLPLYEIDDSWIEEVRAELPVFPKARRAHYVENLGLTAYDAGQLTSTKPLSDFFEAAVAAGGDAKQVSNWLQGAKWLSSSMQKARPLSKSP